MHRKTDAPNQHHKRGNNGQWAPIRIQMQQSTQHCLPLQHHLGRVNQPTTHASMSVLRNYDESNAKLMTGVKKVKGLSVIEDRRYAQAMYAALYLFALDYLK
jgi:hypothetical protein